MEYIKRDTLRNIAAILLVWMAVASGCTVIGIPHDNDGNDNGSGNGADESKRMTMTVTATNDVTIALGGTGSVTIDWGDGSSPETEIVVPFDENTDDIDSYLYSHTYQGTTNRTITVDGKDITFLSGFGNKMTHLDVSKNNVLTFLLLDELDLTSLDMRKNTALTYLSCMTNSLTSIDLSGNIALSELFCDDNELANTDVSKNTALTILSLTANPLTNLDVSKNTMLSDLYIDNCQFTASALNALFGTLHSQTVAGGKTIYISGNPGTADCDKTIATNKGWTVDMGQAVVVVTGITLNKNTLTLDIGASETLTTTIAPIDAENKTVTWKSDKTDIATVDVEGKVTAVKTGIATITATTNDGGKEANCTVTVLSETQQMTITTAKTGMMQILLAGTGTATIDWNDGMQKETHTLTPFNIEAEDYTPYIYTHNYSGSSVRTITIEGQDVTLLECHDQQVTKIDVSKNIALLYLSCGNNLLTGLNVTNNTALFYIDIADCRFTASELNALFDTLHGNTGAKNIYIAANLGTDGCDQSIATAKGWTVNID